MKKFLALFTLFISTSYVSANTNPLSVKNLISPRVFYKCCPGPACVADRWKDEMYALILKNKIDHGEVRVDSLNTCEDLSQALELQR